MRFVLLLRAVNVGGRNKVAMADLRALLESLGHTDVRTVLNSGNAAFTSSRRSAAVLAAEVEQGLRDLGVDVRACVRTTAQVQASLDALPDFPEDRYIVVTTLFDRPSAAALRAFLEKDWSPELVSGDDQVVHLGYQPPMHASKLQNAVLEKALGVSATARTPATLRKLL